MYFQDDFSEMHMMFNQPVEFNVYEQEGKAAQSFTFYMKLPSFQMLHFDSDIKNLISLIHSSVTDLQSQFIYIQNFTSHYQLLQGMALLKSKPLISYINIITNAFNKLGVNLEMGTELNPGKITIDGHIIDEKLFTRMSRIILMAAALKKSTDFIDDPVMRAYQEKIDKIKSQNKAAQNANDQNFKEAYMILTYEFGYKPEEILNMTQYAVTVILGYTSNSIRYKLTLIAAGNGNTKKVKFITDKGK